MSRDVLLWLYHLLFVVCFVIVCLLFLCSILNKLTPDNFEKLSRELVHHAAGSSEIRKGAMLLVRRVGLVAVAGVDMQSLVERGCML